MWLKKRKVWTCLKIQYISCCCFDDGRVSEAIAEHYITVWLNESLWAAVVKCSMAAHAGHCCAHSCTQKLCSKVTAVHLWHGLRFSWIRNWWEVWSAWALTQYIQKNRSYTCYTYTHTQTHTENILAGRHSLCACTIEWSAAWRMWFYSLCGEENTSDVCYSPRRVWTKTAVRHRSWFQCCQPGLHQWRW